MANNLDFTKAKTAVDLLALAGQDTILKRVSASGGGEYAGACPFCGGRDRFRVQPNRPGGGRWFCRQCNGDHWSDAIDYLKRREHITARDAVIKLTGETSTLPQREAPPPEQPKIDRTLWSMRALQFAESCTDALWSDAGKAARTWLTKRGLEPDAIKAAGLGFNPTRWDDDGDLWGLDRKVSLPAGITIPNHDRLGIHGIKVRQSAPTKSAFKYLMVTGSTVWLYGSDTCSGALTACLFESELDALLAWQTGLGMGFIALPAGQKIHRAEYQPYFETVEDVLVVPDNDPEGMKHAGELAKYQGFTQVQPVPYGKDLSEYLQQGGDVLDYLQGELARLPGGKA